MDWQTFDFGETEVRVLAPADAEFDEQNGLPEGMHNLIWSPRDAGFFGVSVVKWPSIRCSRMSCGWLEAWTLPAL